MNEIISFIAQYIMELVLLMEHILPEKTNLVLVYLSEQKAIQVPFFEKKKKKKGHQVEISSTSPLIPTNLKVISTLFPFFFSAQRITLR